MAFDAAENNEKFGRIQYQRKKRSSPLYRTARFKVVPTIFLKIQEGRSLGGRGIFSRTLEFRTQVRKHLSGSRKEQRIGAMEKGKNVGVIEKEVQRDDIIRYFLPIRAEVLFEFQSDDN